MRASEIPTIIERFNGFFDGVVHEVSFQPSVGKPLNDGVVRIATRDITLPEGADNDGWVIVVFRLGKVHELRITNGPTCYNVVLSSGISLFAENDGLTYLVLNADDVKSAGNAKKSECFISCERCDVDIEPYSLQG